MSRVSVLQLDTQFPRIPGDVACPETYLTDPELIRIPGAVVSGIVRSDPDSIDIAPFLDAAKASMGDIVTTSCGFLAPLEDVIAAELDRPFLASSLNALPGLGTQAVQIMSFDEAALSPAHFPPESRALAARTFGIGAGSHLHCVIAGDLPELDAEQAMQEVVAQALSNVGETCEVLLLECTNLPPFKHGLRAALSRPTYDILDRIEAAAPGSIAPAHL